MSDPDHYRRNFEAMGETKVRERLALRDFGELEMKLAPEWLRQKEEARALAQLERNDASQAEQASAASRAADAAVRAASAAETQAAAALEAAREARKANKLAVIANIIALAAMIVGGIALIKSMHAH